MFDKISKLQIAILGFILGLSLIFSASTISRNISKNEISVTGTAYEIVRADNAKWSLTYSEEAPTKVEAYNKLLKSAPVIKKFLTDKGVNENEIEQAGMYSYANYKTNPQGVMTQDIKSYTYQESFYIRSNNVELIKKLNVEIQGLIQQGISISNTNVEYYYSKMPEKKAQLLSAATLDAKNRASGMLKATRNSVGKMRSVKMGVFQITAPESNDVTDWGINDTSTIDKKITAVANVVFAIR